MTNARIILHSKNRHTQQTVKTNKQANSKQGKEKGKERMYLYSAFIVATTLKALRRGSHSFTCK